MSIHPRFGPSKAKYLELAINDVLFRGKVTKGDLVKYLAEEIKTYYDVDYCVLFGSGTIAMYSIIGAMVNSWEFIIPSYTWHSVIWALENKQFGYGDMNPKTYHLEDKNYNTKDYTIDGVMIMDTYGSLASYSHLPKEQIIVDASHSFGTPRKELRGIAEVFSGNGGKLWTTGEGGVVITNDPDVARSAEYFSNLISRMPNLSAAVGLEWFKSIDIILDRRKDIASYFRKHLVSSYVPQEIPIATNNYIFAISVALDIAPKIMEKGIDLGLRQYYNPPLGRGKWTPIANEMSQKIICLPIGFYTNPIIIVDRLNEIMENEMEK